MLARASAALQCSRAQTSSAIPYRCHVTFAAHYMKPGRQRLASHSCQAAYYLTMSTMNTSLPDSLNDFVDEQINQRG